MTKICKICGKEKPLLDFPSHQKMKEGIRNDCFDCYKEYLKKWKNKSKTEVFAVYSKGSPKCECCKEKK